MWIAALSSSEVKKGKAITAKRLGLDLVVWRGASGRVWALHDLCPHRRARLSMGKISNEYVECPYHGFQFDGQGNAVSVPAMGKVAPLPAHIKATAVPTHEEFGIIWLWYGEGEPLTGPRFFDDLAGLSARAEYGEVWPVPLPRAIENQLDVFHLPFVHRNTIGRGGKTIAQGPVIKKIDDYSFKVYPHNEVDVGQKLLRADEVDVSAQNNYLWFIYPNVWENHISEGLRIVAFFAPVDSSSTKIYLIAYLKASGIEPVDRLLVKVLMPFNVYVLHQDRRVVSSQLGDIVGDRLIHADLPIVTYRKMYFADKNLQKLLASRKTPRLAFYIEVLAARLRHPAS
ncbi:aromatic ring-hydroxylating dioxygenase subunit alpha [Tardisphaera miroshnichenkoae]